MQRTSDGGNGSYNVYVHSVMKESYRVLKDYIISKTDPDLWRTVFPTKTSLTKLIIDCGQITELQTVRGIDLSTVERLCTQRDLRN